MFHPKLLPILFSISLLKPIPLLSVSLFFYMTSFAFLIFFGEFQFVPIGSLAPRLRYRIGVFQIRAVVSDGAGCKIGVVV